MLLLGSSLLLVVSIASLLVALGLFTLNVWLKAIIYLCEGQFIRCGFWLCLGILLINLFFGSGKSYTPLYITIMVLAFIATIGKYLLWWQQRRVEADFNMPSPSPPAEMPLPIAPAKAAHRSRPLLTLVAKREE